MYFHEIFHVFFPGENHELHPAKQVTLLGKSISTPSIVVQVCGNEAAEAAGRRIKATRCPDRQNSLDWKVNTLYVDQPKNHLHFQIILEYILKSNRVSFFLLFLLFFCRTLYFLLKIVVEKRQRYGWSLFSWAMITNDLFLKALKDWHKITYDHDHWSLWMLFLSFLTPFLHYIYEISEM